MDPLQLKHELSIKKVELKEAHLKLHSQSILIIGLVCTVILLFALLGTIIYLNT